MSRLLDYAKNIFWVLVFLNILPFLITNIKLNYNAFLVPTTKIGLLTFDAPLSDSRWYVDQLHSFFKDPEIKAIILKIESPGGNSGTAQALFYEIKALKKIHPKPIISISENVCTSGAYYIACSTDFIIASPAALIGNIGARLTTIFDFKNCLEQWNIKSHVISAGKYKAAGDPFTNLTAEQKTMLEEVAASIYEQFMHDVALSRKLLISKKNEWAEGRLLTGQQALHLHLIDAVGSQCTAIEKLKELTVIEHEIEWIEPQPPHGLSSFFDDITGSLHTVIRENPHLAAALLAHQHTGSTQFPFPRCNSTQ